MEIEKALHKFQFLAAGASIKNITLGESPRFFQELCMYAVKLIVEKQEHDKKRLEFKQALDEALNSEVKIYLADEIESCDQYCNDCPHRICGKEEPKPLTLDELRERVGKPVYCTVKDGFNHWMVVDGWNIDEESPVWSDYGTIWLAYDREPAEPRSDRQ